MWRLSACCRQLIRARWRKRWEKRQGRQKSLRIERGPRSASEGLGQRLQHTSEIAPEIRFWPYWKTKHNFSRIADWEITVIQSLGRVKQVTLCRQLERLTLLYGLLIYEIISEMNFFPLLFFHCFTYIQKIYQMKYSTQYANQTIPSKPKHSKLIFK